MVDGPVLATPDGIDEGHDDPPRGVRRIASPLSLILLGAIVAAGLSGWLGGWPNPVVTVERPGAIMTVDTPHIIRNGEFFETRIRVEARRPISDVVVTLTPTLWRDMTINSFIPAPSKEKFEDRQFRFSYGPLDQGKTIEIKIDGQINPPLFAGTRGVIGVADGERMIAEHPLSIRVLP